MQPIPSTAADYNTLVKVIEKLHRAARGFQSSSEAEDRCSISGAKSCKARPIDWGFAETLAFGSLVLEGTPVRLSGEDVIARNVHPAASRIQRLRDGRRLHAAASISTRSRPSLKRWTAC